MNSLLVSAKFVMNIEVADIGNRYTMLGLSWLAENRFLMDTHDRCLRNVNSGCMILCAIS